MMRQYVIDQLSREERANIASFLKRSLEPGPVDGFFWIEVPQDLLNAEQRQHADCGPFFFAVELEEERMCFELLVRSKTNLHCSCIAYASQAQRDFVFRFVDLMLEEEQIRA
jgi:hypothetical protein